LKSHFRSEADIVALVESFESCALPPDAFKHADHLAVVAWYLKSTSERDATDRMRAGLYRFLDAHVGDRQKYHETITVFWVKLVKKFLERMDKECEFSELVNELAEHYGDSKLVFEYYSREIIASDEARLHWIEPDLRRTDF